MRAVCVVTGRNLSIFRAASEVWTLVVPELKCGPKLFKYVVFFILQGPFKSLSFLLQCNRGGLPWPSLPVQWCSCVPGDRRPWPPVSASAEGPDESRKVRRSIESFLFPFFFLSGQVYVSFILLLIRKHHTRPPPARWNANPNRRTQIASEGEDGVGIITSWRASPARTVHPATGRGGFDLHACPPASAVASGTEALVPSSVVR